MNHHLHVGGRNLLPHSCGDLVSRTLGHTLRHRLVDKLHLDRCGGLPSHGPLSESGCVLNWLKSVADGV